MIYIDNNATTKIDDEVLVVMMPFLKENYGNASSKSHSLGWIAEEAVENSRQQIADLINADSQEIIFTSGATESLNIAIQGLYRELGKTKNEIIVCTTEHNAVLETCNYLSEQGIIQHQLNVNREGLIDIDELKKLINKNTLFVAVMLANNETGVINNAEDISKVVHTIDSCFI
jgi:cysteine desulfurase